MRNGGGSDAERLTAFGRFLRATSLDELPELWNVLKGEMSLVGPRPLPVRYLPRYSPVQARRHEVLPGLTGWAQVHGRNNVPWPERIALNVWYARHMSFALDARIFLTTIFKVALMKDHYSKARQLEER
jgi:lipopolysaccharide/colanic/teichoic acid biosynthesis glycosyltransferase